MKCRCVLSCLILLALTVHAVAEELPIIPPDAVVEVVSTGGYLFTEGPALAPDGSIYFSDIPNNAIHRYDPATGETTLFTNDSGGANGLMFISGSLWACSGDKREVRLYPARWENNEAFEKQNIDDGLSFRHEPLAGAEITHFDGKRLNRPNDIAFTSTEEDFFLIPTAVYFTDPIYGRVDPIELPSEAVYALTPNLNQPDGTMQIHAITRLIDDLVRPNGIGVSPDDQTLYVNDNGDEKIWAYPILEPGKVGEGRLLNDLADLGGPDGMTVGPKGNIYTTIYGKGVLILSPDGERLGFLDTGPQTTNCVFGADGKTLYVTAEKSLKRVVLNTGVE
ncbi:MAG: SMP-30/gluconolactonase/LRE family protein [Planctomycetota bacterium]